MLIIRVGSKFYNAIDSRLKRQQEKQFTTRPTASTLQGQIWNTPAKTPKVVFSVTLVGSYIIISIQLMYVMMSRDRMGSVMLSSLRIDSCDVYPYPHHVLKATISSERPWLL